MYIVNCIIVNNYYCDMSEQLFYASDAMESKGKSANLKREREKNWKWEEKLHLKEAIAPYADVIDSKINNTHMIAKKSEAWVKINNEMQLVGVKVGIPKLKAQWTRMKTAARSNIAAYKQQLNATGGGHAPKEPDELDISIQFLLPLDFEEDIAALDSDGHRAEINNKNSSACAAAMSDVIVVDDANNSGAKNCIVIASDGENANEVPNTSQIKKRKLETSKVPDSAFLIKKRVEQIEEEIKCNSELFELKKKILLKELDLINIKIKNEQKK